MTDGADTVSSRSRVLLVMGNIAVAVDECVLSLDFANAIKNELFLGQARVRNASGRQSLPNSCFSLS